MIAIILGALSPMLFATVRGPAGRERERERKTIRILSDEAEEGGGEDYKEKKMDTLTCLNGDFKTNINIKAIVVFFVFVYLFFLRAHSCGKYDEI